MSWRLIKQLFFWRFLVHLFECLSIHSSFVSVSSFCLSSLVHMIRHIEMTKLECKYFSCRDELTMIYGMTESTSLVHHLFQISLWFIIIAHPHGSSYHFSASKTTGSKSACWVNFPSCRFGVDFWSKCTPFRVVVFGMAKSLSISQRVRTSKNPSTLNPLTIVIFILSFSSFSSFSSLCLIHRSLHLLFNEFCAVTTLLMWMANSAQISSIQ